MKTKLDADGFWSDEYVCQGLCISGEIIVDRHYVTGSGELHLWHYLERNGSKIYVPPVSVCPSCEETRKIRKFQLNSGIEQLG